MKPKVKPCPGIHNPGQGFADLCAKLLIFAVTMRLRDAGAWPREYIIREQIPIKIDIGR